MAKSGVVARHLRTLLQVGAVGVLSDGQLLERFITRRGEAAEAAFAALVERHGPMVLGVCRRALADPRDAEDAFQATFLVLVKKARTVRVDDSLGRWLYGVACRVAARARTRAARRQAREGEALVDRAGLAFDADRLELRKVLDEELHRLPEKYRAPVLLCYLEGLTHEMAAERLGWPVGTVRGRLSRAREQLRTRLSRRGLAPTAGLWAVPPMPRGLSEALAEKTVQAALRYATARGAAGGISTTITVLVEGALKTMVLSKLKMSATASLVMVATSMAAPFFLAASDPQSGPGHPGTPPAKKAEPKPSSHKIEASELAARAFGPTHWTADKALPVRYYNHDRGYWMYAKDYERLEGGKQLRFRPFAIVWKSRDGNALKTATGDEAVVDLNRPLDVASKSSSSMKVVHARIEGNVRICEGKETPDPGDDLVIGPMSSVEFDEASLNIRSKSDVTIERRGMRITGSGLSIQLRANDGPEGDIGAKFIDIYSNSHVKVDGVDPSKAVPVKPEAGKGDEGPTSLDLRCAGNMRIEWPRPKGDVEAGPPAPPGPTTLYLSGDVVVFRGHGGPLRDQLNCDELRLTLRSALALGSGMGLRLHEMHATGHAVWLQLQGQGITARCNELIHKKFLPERPDETYLRGDGKNKLWVEKVETAVDGPDRGKVLSVITVRTNDATIFEDARGGDNTTIVTQGPGLLETRPARDRPVEGKALWQDHLILRTELDAQKWPTRVLTITGHPEWIGPHPEQARLGAGQSILIRLEPQAK